MWFYEILIGMLLIYHNTTVWYMEHGLEYITFYVQKHITPLAVYSGPLLVCDKLLGVPAFVRLAYYLSMPSITTMYRNYILLIYVDVIT